MADWNCYCDQCTGMLEPPQPCEYCFIASGEMKDCDRCCDSLTQKRYEAFYGRYRWQGKQLIHQGRKP